MNNNKKAGSVIVIALLSIAVYWLLPEHSNSTSAMANSPLPNTLQNNPPIPLYNGPATLPQTRVQSNKLHVSASPQSASPQSASQKQDEDTLPLDPIERIRAIQEKTELHEALLEDHDRFVRYPANNQRIDSVDQDPVEKRYELDERETLSEQGDISLTIWSDKKFYLHGDQAIIFATLRDATGATINTKFMGQLIFNEQASLLQFELLDLDQDGLHEFHLDLTQIGNQALAAGVYKVLIVNNSNELADAVSFILSEPNIVLTGNYRDRLTADGSLVIEAEAVVNAHNRFYLQASLYSSTNDPIGTSQFAAELNPGRHWLALSFDGLMIRDADEPGPYLLKNVSLAKVALPIQRAPLIHPEYYTQGYTVDQFRSAPSSAETPDQL